MIVNTLVDLFLDVIMGAFNTFQFLELPLGLMSALSSILAYGIWIIGLDIMTIFVSSVVFWWAFQMSIGLIVWVWEHLPLT